MTCDVVFFSPMCVFDNASGAAVCMKTYLETLARAGFQCRSFTASLFDPATEVDLRRAIHGGIDQGRMLHKQMIVNRAGVEHNIFVTTSTQARKLTREESRLFRHVWSRWLAANQPRIMLTYGGSAFSREMHQLAREHGAQVVHYVANAEFKNLDQVLPGDQVICPSRFLAELYQEKCGVSAKVLYPIIDANRVASVEEPEHRRCLGLVTFMNPIPHKGLALLYSLASRAQQEKTEWTFLVTMGRIDPEAMRRGPYNLYQLDNVWMLPNQADVRAIYRRSAVLLVPSLWREGFGRNIVEAQMSGVPVLANDIGGISEAINGGGGLFPVPHASLNNYLSKPDDSVIECWWVALTGLLDDSTVYRAAVAQGLASTALFEPSRTELAVVEHVGRLVRGA